MAAAAPGPRERHPLTKVLPDDRKPWMLTRRADKIRRSKNGMTAGTDPPKEGMMLPNETAMKVPVDAFPLEEMDEDRLYWRSGGDLHKTYPVRIGPDYNPNRKTKAPSMKEIYDGISFDIYRYNEPTGFVSPQIAFPPIPADLIAAAGVKEGEAPPLPYYLVLTLDWSMDPIPLDTSMLTSWMSSKPFVYERKGVGCMLVGIALCRVDAMKEAAAKAGPRINAIRLAQRYAACDPDVSKPEHDDMSMRLKSIVHLGADDVSSLPFLVRAPLARFNGTPMLARGDGDHHCFPFRGVGPRSVLEIGLDSRTTSRIPRRAMNSLLPDGYYKRVLSVAVLLEGVANDELPECILSIGQICLPAKMKCDEPGCVVKPMPIPRGPAAGGGAATPPVPPAAP